MILAEPLTDAGLVNALQTAVEAKALAAAQVSAVNTDGFATGTATDSACIVCPPGGRATFAGPATPHGGDVARAVYQAVMVGAAVRQQARGRSSWASRVRVTSRVSPCGRGCSCSSDSA